MASEIIMRTVDQEKDTFEMLMPLPSEITANTVINGSPCHFGYGALAFVQHSLKVEVNIPTIGITITVAEDSKENDPPILIDGYKCHLFFRNGMTQGIIRQDLQKVPVTTNEDGFGNTKYIYQWTSNWTYLNRVRISNIRKLKFVFNVKLTLAEEGVEKNCYGSDMSKFLMNAFLSDFEIICENETLKAHRNVLASKSPKLHAMFNSDMKENRERRLIITSIKLEVLKELLRFMYTGNVDFKPDYLLDLFKAADEYLMPYLKDVCIRQIIKEISLENALDVYSVAVDHDFQALHDVVLKFLKINKRHIVDGPEKFVDLCQRYPELISTFPSSRIFLI